jgi:hypothetical protein
MKRIARNILKHLPYRRARQWRYISPHRRGAGVVILALLTAGVAGYWVLPILLNDWTRSQAAGYLRSFTGGLVRVDRAHFSLFGGVKLHGVSIDVPDSPGKERFFQADTVVLHHRPWSLLSQGRLEATEIVCIAPTVTLVYDAEKGRYTAEELIAAARRRQAARRGKPLAGRLPVISIRDVRLRLLTGETRLNISLVPAGPAYRITLAEQRGGGDPLRGTWLLDLASGELRLKESNIPTIAKTDGILPQRYAKWRKRYDIQGKVVLKGRPAAAPAEAILDAQLEDVSLRLQPDEGGLQLAGVHGTLTFRQDGVTAGNLTGRIPQAANAAFQMKGHYGGYDANCPFDLRVVVTSMSLPDSGQVSGWLAETLKFLQDTYRPSGKLDIRADFRRLADGRIELRGSAQPRGMTFVYDRFPYRLEQVGGTIGFVSGPSEQRVYLTDLSARRGAAEVTVTGVIDLRPPGQHDVTISGRNLRLDAEMRSALPRDYQDVWDCFGPAGTAGAAVRVQQVGRGKPEQVQLTLSMDGRTSMCYQGFPYRLEELTGELRVNGGTVTVDSVRGRRGPMRCTIDGVVGGLGSQPSRTDLKIEATDLPLDAGLVAALPAWARKEAASLHATGLARRVSATVRKAGKDPFDFRIVARVEQAAFRPDAFPYAVQDANGVFTIRPGRVILEDVHGRRGKTKVALSGQVLVGAEPPGLDLRVQGQDVDLNDELFGAVPPEAQRLWRKLSPRGCADVDLSVRHGMPEAQRPVDYRLVLQAKGMQVCYQDFPYSLEGIAGRVVATPEGVRLEDLAARHGPAKLTVNGALVFSSAAEEADLSIRGTNVPIDAELLAAVRGSLAPLARRFRAGGSCELDLKHFRVLRPLPASEGPQVDSRPAGAAAATSRPAAQPLRWSAEGRVAFSGATVDLGLGHKTLSGSLTGAAAQTGDVLALNADIRLDSVQVGQQRLTKLSGRLTKDPRSPLMRLDDMSALAHGGRLAGFAEVRLSDPLEFGISLSVDRIRLEDLFQGGAGARGSEVRGRLVGSVELTAVVGKEPRRQGSGMLRISEGKLYKLPVLLGLLHVLYLSLPGETAFTHGTIAYHLRNDTLIFDEIYLRGAALSIVGSGTMDMKTEALDLLFLSGPPQKLPRLGSLTELLEGIAREVAQVHVSGTLKKPKMRTVPLRRLDQLLRDLLNPGRTR